MSAAAGLRRVEQVMGMPVYVDVRDGIEPGVLDDVFAWFHLVDSIFSTYREDSEISRLNVGRLGLAECRPDVRAVIELCRALRPRTSGYFDAEAVSPGAIDPSGLVKGWAVDRAAAILLSADARNFYVNAGGDIRVRGGALPQPRWRIGIQHPVDRDRIAVAIDADDLAIATSGAYIRGEHIVDPHTGRAPRGLLSVTVVGPDLAMADGFATAAFAMGADGPEWTRGIQPFEALSITQSGEVLATAGFPPRLPPS